MSNIPLIEENQIIRVTNTETGEVVTGLVISIETDEYAEDPTICLYTENGFDSFEWCEIEDGDVTVEIIKELTIEQIFKAVSSI